MIFTNAPEKGVDVSVIKNVFVTGLTFPLAKAITELEGGEPVYCISNISKPVKLGAVCYINEARYRDGYDVGVKVSTKDTGFDENAQFRFINGPCNVAYLVQLDTGV